ncbi:MAG TPA: ATP-grasp domain-containing protein [Rhizomicrobium sp.]
MRILVLHSDIAEDAPPEEQDTLIAAKAVAAALHSRGHMVSQRPFTQATLGELLSHESPDIVFNLVEGVDGLGQLAPIAPRLLEEMGIAFTGAGAAAMDLTNDKPLTKQRLRDAGLATPGWSEPPDWRGLGEGTYIVKSALEDASLGLDDGCVVSGAEAVKRRARECETRHGGRWFAEEFVEGREFNIAVLQGKSGPLIFPMAEMRFDSWPMNKPRIVGYDAKWDESSPASLQTVRAFGVEQAEPLLATRLRAACEKVWVIFGLSGFARVDFRVSASGEPLILEINTNPCISPDAGFAAAAAEAGVPYDLLIARIVEAAIP